MPFYPQQNKKSSPFGLNTNHRFLVIQVLAWLSRRVKKQSGLILISPL